MPSPALLASVLQQGPTQDGGSASVGVGNGAGPNQSGTEQALGGAAISNPGIGLSQAPSSPGFNFGGLGIDKASVDGALGGLMGAAVGPFSGALGTGLGTKFGEGSTGRALGAGIGSGLGFIFGGPPGAFLGSFLGGKIGNGLGAGSPTAAAPSWADPDIGNTSDDAGSFNSDANAAGPANATASQSDATTYGEASMGGPDGGGGGGGGKVICTELHRRGLISDDYYRADAAFGARQSNHVLAGYWLWAVPVRDFMRGHTWFAYLMLIIAVPWVMEMAYREAGLGQGHWIGRFYLWTGVPICRWLGRHGVKVAHG